MAHTRGTGILTPLLLASNAIIWVSSIIVLGITAWFIHTIGNSGGRHLTYMLVVATLTAIVWPAAILLSRSDSRRGFRLPLNLIFSYLWLSAFVVSTDNWASNSCPFGAGPFGRCGHKHSVMAFNFLAFFFCALNVLADHHYASRVVDGPIVGSKHGRHSTDNRAAVV